MAKIESVCVYCGSGPGNDPAFAEAASAFGQELARAGVRLVFGGGSGGMMGAVADAVLDNGGAVTGIIPKFLIERERAHTRVDELIVTNDMHERKWAMFEHADAFVALPGGVGTLEELIEILTWAQLGRHEKPILIVNVKGFWEPLSALLDHMNREGFLHSLDKLKPIFVDKVADILPALRNA